MSNYFPKKAWFGGSGGGGTTLPTYVNGQYLTNDGTNLSWAANGMGDLLANGTVPLTADWAAGAFKITMASMQLGTSNYAYFTSDGSIGSSWRFNSTSNNNGVSMANGSFIPLADQSMILGQASYRWNGVFSTDYNAGSRLITAGTGTGLTVDTAGALNRQVYKVTVDYTGFSSAGSLTADHTIATLPAKTKIVGFYADTTIPWVGTGVTAVALTVGKSAGGVEYIATHDVKTAAITIGLADADMGTELTRAAAIQGGAVVNWSGTTPVSARITTTTAHTDDLTAGSTTFYIVTERY